MPYIIQQPENATDYMPVNDKTVHKTCKQQINAKQGSVIHYSAGKIKSLQNKRKTTLFLILQTKPVDSDCRV